MATGEGVDRTNREQSMPAVAPLNRESLNAPNLITVSRLILALIVFTLIWIEWWWIGSAILFVIAVSTDALDGWIARRYGLVTTLGRILDPFADKFIIGGMFVFLLGKEHTANGELLRSGVNAWMAIAVLGREMFVTSLRGFLEQQGKDFSASLSGKLKMVIQCVAVTVSLLSLSPRVVRLLPWISGLRDVLLWTAVVVTIWSGLIYVVRAQQLLREPAAE